MDERCRRLKRKAAAAPVENSVGRRLLPLYSRRTTLMAKLMSPFVVLGGADDERQPADPTD